MRQLEFNAQLANKLPKRGIDTSYEQSCAREIELDDIEWAKSHIIKHTASSTNGPDDFSYKDILAIDNEVLLNLFRECIHSGSMPSIWLESMLVAILKPGKRADNAGSYRLVALECCMLKMLTLIIDRRLREWAAVHNAIPASQNGFREGFRTINNPFILRCLAEKAESQGKTLFVGLIDLKNAFPSTDRSTLWVKLHCMGISGPLLDWLKMLYREMTYMVKQGHRCSAEIVSILGILAGDPGSPNLWNLFLADFKMSWHPDDMFLNGVHVPKLEHADDIATASASVPGFQLKLWEVETYAGNNGCEVSLVKSVYMILGPKPAVVPGFFLGGQRMECVTQYPYVGQWFQSSRSFLFAEHYVVQAMKAKRISKVCLATEGMVGTLPAWDARTLYMSRVDPYLTSGCEVAIDTDDSKLALLEDVQKSYLRRMLGVGSRSMQAILFSETGIWPIKYRRLYLALKYLLYLVGLPHDRLAWHALMQSMTLARQGQHSWVNDLCVVLAKLPVTVGLDIQAPLTSEIVSKCMKNLVQSMESTIQGSLERSPKVQEMLCGRMERNWDGDIEQQVLAFRHYLRIEYAPHRLALTQLILSCHSLASERMRWAECYREPIPKQWRLCRFCGLCTEDPPPMHCLYVHTPP